MLNCYFATHTHTGFSYIYIRDVNHKVVDGHARISNCQTVFSTDFKPNSIEEVFAIKKLTIQLYRHIVLLVLFMNKKRKKLNRLILELKN